MSRKEDSKAQEAGNPSVITVNVDDFTRTRDAVLLSLANLQSAVSDVSRAYISHANTLLNRGKLDKHGIPASLLDNKFLSGALGIGDFGRGAEDRKRKKRKHDPNAPKRALTPYFLYLQHNRQVVARELGPAAKPKAVSDECARRWVTMDEAEKEGWRQKYLENFAKYRDRLAAYKAGNPVPEDDAASKQLQESVQHATEAVEAESESSSEESSESESERESPAREPTPPRSSKRRRTAGAAPPSPAKKSSPEKKKKTDKKKDEGRRSLNVVETFTPRGVDKRAKKERRSKGGD